MDRFCKSIAIGNSNKEWDNYFQKISEANGPAFIVAGHLAYRRCEYDAALPYYLKAKQKLPNDSELRLALARTHRNLQQFDQAVQNFNDAISSTRDSRKKSQIYSELIRLLVWSDRSSSISPLTKQALYDFKKSPQYVEKILSTLKQLGKNDLAIELTEKLISQSKGLEKKFSYRLQVAELYGLAGKQNDSLRLYEKLMNETDREGQFSNDVLDGIVRLHTSNGEHFKLFDYLFRKIEWSLADKKTTKFDRHLFQVSIESAITVLRFDEAIRVIDHAIKKELITKNKTKWIEQRISIEIRLNDVSALKKSFDQLSKLRVENPSQLFSKVDLLKQINFSGKNQVEELRILEQLKTDIYESLLVQAKSDPSIHERLGRRFFENRNYIKAIELTSKAVDANPENHHWRYQLGLYYLHSNLSEKAIELWEQLQLGKSVSTSLHLQVISELSRSGFNEKAFQYNKSLVEDETVKPAFELLSSLARQFIERKDFSAAGKLLKQMVLVAANERQLQEVFNLEKNSLNAQGIFQQHITKRLQEDDLFNSDVELQRFLYCLTSAREFNKAISIQKQILKKNPESEAEVEKLANLYVSDKQYEKAISAFRNILSKSQISAISVLKKIGRIQKLSGDDKATEETLRIILSLTPSNENAIFELATHQLEHANKITGIQILKSLLAQGFSKDSVREQVLNQLVKNNNKKLILKTIQARLVRASSLSEKIEIVGQVKKFDGRDRLAKSLLKQITTLKKKSQWKRSSVEVAAEIYSAISQTESAIQQLEALKEKDFFLFLKTSRLAEDAGQYEKAIANLNRAKNQSPLNLPLEAVPEDIARSISNARLSKLHIQLARAFDSKNQPQLATNHFEKAFEYYPTSLFETSQQLFSSTISLPEKILRQREEIVSQTLMQLVFSEVNVSPLKIISLMSKVQKESTSPSDLLVIQKYWKAFPEYRYQLIQRNMMANWETVPELFNEIYFSFTQEKKEPNRFSLLKITIPIKDSKPVARVGLITRFLNHIEREERLIKLLDDVGEPNSDESKIIQLLTQYRITPSKDILANIIGFTKSINLPESVLYVIGLEISQASSSDGIIFYESIFNEEPRYQSQLTKELLNLYSKLNRKVEARKLLFKLRLASPIDFSDRVDRAMYLLDIQSQIAKDLIQFQGSFEAFWIASFMKRYVAELGDKRQKQIWLQRINHLIESSKNNLISAGSS